MKSKPPEAVMAWGWYGPDGKPIGVFLNKDDKKFCTQPSERYVRVIVRPLPKKKPAARVKGKR